MHFPQLGLNLEESGKNKTRKRGNKQQIHPPALEIMAPLLRKFPSLRVLGACSTTRAAASALEFSRGQRVQERMEKRKKNNHREFSHFLCISGVLFTVQYFGTPEALSIFSMQFCAPFESGPGQAIQEGGRNSKFTTSLVVR